MDLITQIQGIGYSLYTGLSLPLYIILFIVISSKLKSNLFILLCKVVLVLFLLQSIL